MTPVSILSRLCVVICAAAAVTRVVADVFVEPKILEKIASGPVRVIVELHLEGGFSPEGELTANEVRVQRHAIVAAQESIFTELANGKARVVRRPETVPFLVLEIGAPALAELRAMPDRVVHILADDTAATKRFQQ